MVEVTVSGVRDGHGIVRAAVCTRKEFLQKHCARNGVTPARPGTVVVSGASVPPGTYAVQAWHDENDNGRTDRDLLSIPREEIGFSRDPVLLLGPPGFADARFEVGQDGSRTALKLRYFKD